MKNIMVAIDFINNEKLLIDTAYLMAERFDSKIWLIHIAAPEPDFVGYEVGPQYIREFRAEELRKEHKLLQEYTNTLKKKQPSCNRMRVWGFMTSFQQ